MNTIMEIGLGLALGVSFLYLVRRQTWVPEIKIFQWGLVAAAGIYFTLSLIKAPISWIAIEGIGILVYGVFAWLGARYTPAWIGIGWLLHPIWDGFLHLYGPAPDVVPHWYAMTCLVFDGIIGLYILLGPLREMEKTIQGYDLIKEKQGE